MIPVENFRGYIASIVAGLLAIGGPAALVFVWMQPADPTRDLSVIFAALGAASAGGSTFLFLQDSAARSSRATERAAEASSGQTRTAIRSANGNGFASVVSAPLVSEQYAERPFDSQAYEAGWRARDAQPVATPSEDPPPAELGEDRFEGDVEPDQGEKHPDEPQRAMPEGADPEGEEVPETPQRDS